MFANLPPLGLFQVQTFGGTYSDELGIVYTRLFCRSINNCGSSSSAVGDFYGLALALGGVYLCATLVTRVAGAAYPRTRLRTLGTGRQTWCHRPPPEALCAASREIA